MMPRVKLFSLLSILLFAGVACDTNNSTDSTPFQSQSIESEPTGRIVFQSNRDDSSGIYIMDADGDNVKRVTNERDFHPDLSSDGLIVYESEIDGQRDIFVTSFTGEETPINLTNTEDTWEYFPAWSSDNSQIIYVSDVDGDEEIWVMDADGSNQTQLTDNGRVKRRCYHHLLP
jgi:Tol biopolymer transport system component